MGAPGPEHISFATLDPTDLIGDIIAQFVTPYLPGSMSTAPGKVLYFPPGDWRLNLTSDLVLPEQVEVMFAPGARVIAVGRGTSLEIRGKLTAPVGQIFMTQSGASLGGVLSGFEASNLSRIVLNGDRLACVHPEWWGAGKLRSRPLDTLVFWEAQLIAAQDADALEDAIVAATRRDHGSVVVELLGTYLLSRTVRVGSGPFPPAGTALNADGDPTEFYIPLEGAEVDEVEIRGRLREPGDPTFRAIPGFLSPRFEGLDMVDVRAVRSVRIRAVSFDTGGVAAGCLAIRDPFQFTAEDAPHEIVHCTFRGTPGRVNPSALLRAQRSHPSTVVMSGGGPPVPHLRVEACLFEPLAASGVAVRLIGGGSASAEFRGCIFAGLANAMIHASSFEVIATSCRFENNQFPAALSQPGAQDRVSRLHDSQPEGGLDVFLDSAPELPVIPPPPPPPPPFVPESRASPIGPFLKGALLRTLVPGVVVADAFRELSQWNWSVGAATATGYFVPPSAVVPRGIVPQGSISAQDCRSTSPQFLATASGAVLTSTADGVLIGLHHSFRPIDAQIPLTNHPPAINWRAGRGQDPVSLLLVGCRLDGITSLSLPRVMVMPFGTTSTSTGRPSVIDYGICDGANPGALPGTMGLFQRGILLGVVPPR